MTSRARLRPLFLLLIAGCLGISASARAQGTGLPVLHYVAAPFVPYTVTAADGAATGPTAQLVDTLSRRLQQPAVLTVLPFARAFATAENEPDTLIALIARTPDREHRFHWLCPVLDYEVQMFRRRERGDVTAANTDGLKRWRIAGVMQDVKTNYLQRNGIVVIPAADENEAVRLLLHGRVDAVASHPAGIRQRLREMGERGDTATAFLPLPELSMKLYLAMGKRTEPAVADRVAAACTAMTASGEIARLLQAPKIN
jgi:polar amino acid transport system substrate-binding protein